MKKRLLLNTGKAGQRYFPTQWALFCLFLFTILFSGLISISQPVVTVRFANPEYDCVTQMYTVDVEFQSDTPDKQLYGMNVRFFYNDYDLEFISFGEFVTGYGAVSPNPPYVTTSTAYGGELLFGFDGPYEYINGAIQKTGSTSLTLSTTSWTKIFNMSFLIDDPESFNSGNFCPSLVWDLKEDGSGGISAGIIITLVQGSGSTQATPAVVQFNWAYGGSPGFHGNPVETDCISTICGIAPATNLPLSNIMAPGMVDIPVWVTDFNDITEFTLAFEYDPAVMTYSNFTPHTSFNGALVVTDVSGTGGKRNVNLSYSGDVISLPDSSDLALIHFNFLMGETALNWLADGVSCKYFGPGNIPLPDTPYSDFYLDGSVTLLLAPLTKIDSAVAQEGDFVSFPVKVWDYNNIQGGSLTLDFDPASLTYYNATPHAALNGSFTANIISSGRLGMSWSGNSISLPDGSVLVYVTFLYAGGVIPLVWFDDGTSCQYFYGGSGSPLYAEPFSTFYIDGNVAPAEFVWTGEISGDWDDAGNWFDSIVPDRFTNVTLDPSFSRSENWPAFDGDFTLGIHCKNLVINANAQFSVSGDLTINPGHTLEMTGSGTLHIGGGWTNSGTFIPGTGTVRFNGPDPSEIGVGVPPADYVAAYILTSFDAGMTPVTGGIAGPTGDNAHSDVPLGFDFTYLGTTYSQARVNTNGWLSMNLSGDDGSSSDNNMLFESFGPSTVIAPWWDDLTADAGSSISYVTTGVAPDRIFTVEWKDILSYSSGSTVRLNFQVKLHETTNVIEFCYGDKTAGTHHSLEGASIGIKDATGGPGNYLEATLNTTHIPFPCLRSETDWPTNNYRFTPPAENNAEVFYHVIIEKINGVLAIQKDTQVTGTN
jgi:hypothetical protein